MLRKNIKRKDLINNVYLNIGFSKVISENIVNDVFNLFIHNVMSKNIDRKDLYYFPSYEITKEYFTKKIFQKLFLL